MFSKKATKIDEIFTVDLTICSMCQIDGEDFVKFCGLHRKHELYEHYKVAGNSHLSGSNKFSVVGEEIFEKFCS